MVRERPIPEIYGETEEEARVRRLINARWAWHEKDCLERGWPILLPEWDGPTTFPTYKDPTREMWEYTAAHRYKPHRPEAAPPAPPPGTYTEEERRVRDARQKQLAQKAKKDRKVREKLMAELLPLVIWQAKKQRGLGLDIADLVQEGMLGVQQAIEGYTPQRGASFASYATTWSHGNMRRAIANQGRAIRVPEYRTILAGKLRKVYERLKHELGRVPTEREVARVAGVPVWDVQQAAVETARIESVEVIAERAEQDTPLGFYLRGFLRDPTGEPEALVMRRVLPDGVREALRTLEPRDRRVLWMRYLDGYTRREISEKTGLSAKAPRNVTSSRDSYELKHIAERFFRERGDHDPYVSNASIKGALIEAGYEPVWDDPINMGFRVGPRPGSDWAEKPHGPRVSGPSLLHTAHPIPEYPASRARRQHHRRNV